MYIYIYMYIHLCTLIYVFIKIFVQDDYSLQTGVRSILCIADIDDNRIEYRVRVLHELQLNIHKIITRNNILRNVLFIFFLLPLKRSRIIIILCVCDI